MCTVFAPALLLVRAVAVAARVISNGGRRLRFDVENLRYRYIHNEYFGKISAPAAGRKGALRALGQLDYPGRSTYIGVGKLQWGSAHG